MPEPQPNPLRDAYRFWHLDDDHPLKDGQPLDEHIGAYHIKFGVMSHEDEEAPSFEVHDSQHRCLGHLHSHGAARLLCAGLIAVPEAYRDEVQEDR